MFTAVYADRSGRIVRAADYAAAVSNGAITLPLGSSAPLPPNAEIVPLLDRAAIGLDRSGHPRPLGPGRFAAAAIVPPGWLRIACPAYVDSESATSLPSRAYAAVAAESSGDLVVSALQIGPATPLRSPASTAAISEGLRARPANRLVRQLARCAREYRCRAASNAFLAAHDCALVVGAPVNEHPPDLLTLHDPADAAPTEPAAFRPTPEEMADVAAAHLEAGGDMVVFGRACEGEPLLAARTIEAAIAAIRGRTSRGTIHLETNGSVPAALARLCEAGVDSVAFRLASARSEGFEALHRPQGFRLSDVRASMEEAVTRGVPVALRVLVLPGLTDRPAEIDALASLAGEVPGGGCVILRDLAADPRRALALVRTSEQPLGVEQLVARLRADASHLTLLGLARPLVRL